MDEALFIVLGHVPKKVKTPLEHTGPWDIILDREFKEGLTREVIF